MPVFKHYERLHSKTFINFITGLIMFTVGEETLPAFIWAFSGEH
jgi:hypothetical protein